MPLKNRKNLAINGKNNLLSKTKFLNSGAVFLPANGSRNVYSSGSTVSVVELNSHLNYWSTTSNGSYIGHINFNRDEFITLTYNTNDGGYGVRLVQTVNP
ncbi:hypothetical protein HMPREF0648_1083 [Prevotella bivia JCVIHMP010]|nr:hypothetical protein HMPREF0648_1083 [Prevotella bivia JCVIHMP010]